MAISPIHLASLSRSMARAPSWHWIMIYWDSHAPPTLATICIQRYMPSVPMAASTTSMFLTTPTASLIFSLASLSAVAASVSGFALRHPSCLGASVSELPDWLSSCSRSYVGVPLVLILTIYTIPYSHDTLILSLFDIYLFIF